MPKNFQQIKKEGGFWAYRKFLGIDIKNELDKKKEKYYEHLLKSFEIRHRLIHGSYNREIHIKLVDYQMLQKNDDILQYIRKSVLSHDMLLKERIKTLTGEMN
jgi:hypothetical protein